MEMQEVLKFYETEISAARTKVEAMLTKVSDLAAQALARHSEISATGDFEDKNVRAADRAAYAHASALDNMRSCIRDVVVTIDASSKTIAHHWKALA